MMRGSLAAEVVGPASTGMAAEITAESMFGWAATPAVGIVVAADKEVGSGSLLFMITAATVPSTTLSTTRAAAAAAVSAVSIPEAWALFVVAATEDKDASPVAWNGLSGVVVDAIVLRFDSARGFGIETQRRPIEASGRYRFRKEKERTTRVKWVEARP